MRKYVLGFSLLLSVSATQIAGAQAAASSTPVGANNNASVAATPDAVSMESFADVAALGQEIALAQRRIQAMTLKNSLDALEAQQNMGDFSLKVLRVEGFNNSLYAVLTDDSGAIYQAGPGDLVNKQYRVTLLRPYSVGVVDINTQKFSTVPFQTGGGIVGATTVGGSELAPTSSPVPQQPTSSS